MLKAKLLTPQNSITELKKMRKKRTHTHRERQQQQHKIQMEINEREFILFSARVLFFFSLFVYFPTFICEKCEFSNLLRADFVTGSSKRNTSNWWAMPVVRLYLVCEDFHLGEYACPLSALKNGNAKWNVAI